MITATGKIYTIDKRDVILRSGVYCPFGLSTGFVGAAYFVDSFGNIFYQEDAGCEWALCKYEQFAKAEREGFHWVRGLSYNEIFTLKREVEIVMSIKVKSNKDNYIIL